MQSIVQLECRSGNGELLGSLTVSDRRGRETLSEADGELTFSELGDYLIRFVGPHAGAYRFALPVEQFPTSSDSEALGLLGRPPGLGLVRLELRSEVGVLRWRRDFAVRPEKLRDVAEFEAMVSDLCAWRTALAIDLHAQSSAPWVWSEATHAITPEERLVMLRSSIEDNGLFESLAYIERFAMVRLNRDIEMVGVGREQIDPFGLGRHLNGPGARSQVPVAHPISARLTSLPSRLPPARKVESVDTPENQFVKVTLQRFQAALAEAQRELSYYRGSSLMRWAADAEMRLARISRSPFFSKISWPTHVALGSPALQRREGYRSVLGAFLSLRAGFSMPWDDLGAAVFGETRDTPTIYEFWCLLRLREALTTLGADLTLDHFLVEDGRLRVRRGAGSQSKVPINLRGQSWALSLYYNRNFSSDFLGLNQGFRTHGQAIGTWSKSMKPDFTVALHPPQLTERQAAEQGVLRLVHFDAKYRLRLLPSAEEASHVPDDLDKMHAYVAGINHSVGAYVLYPGDAVQLLAAPSSAAAVGVIPLAPKRMERLNSEIVRTLERAADC